MSYHLAKALARPPTSRSDASRLPNTSGKSQGLVVVHTPGREFLILNDKLRRHLFMSLGEPLTTSSMAPRHVERRSKMAVQQHQQQQQKP